MPSPQRSYPDFVRDHVLLMVLIALACLISFVVIVLALWV
jgi:hypothetical protein